MTQGIREHCIAETPLAVIDVETTGPNAGADRIVEIAVVRIDPGHAPQLVLETLINPQRRMAATEIHGLTDADVREAPRFADIAGELTRVLTDCVVGAYNVYFDMKFLSYELAQAGVVTPLPHLCLMYMRPMIGIGTRCSLSDACTAHSVSYEGTHQAAADARAAANLWPIYTKTMRERRLATFGDLEQLKSYKFVQSFVHAPLVSAVAAPRSIALKKRGIASSQPPQSERSERRGVRAVFSTFFGHGARHEYWQALLGALSDLNITEDEVRQLEQKQRTLALRPEEIRSLHARAFADVLSECITDKWLDPTEQERIKRFQQCLSRLGWAPGE